MADRRRELEGALRALAREYLAAVDAYDAARDRPIADDLDVRGWIRACDAAKDRVCHAKAALRAALEDHDG